MAIRIGDYHASLCHARVGQVFFLMLSAIIQEIRYDCSSKVNDMNYRMAERMYSD